MVKWKLHETDRNTHACLFTVLFRGPSHGKMALFIFCVKKCVGFDPLSKGE